MQTVRVDFAHGQGHFRPLHGINKGPLAAGGLIDVSEAQRALGLPFIRLHDCHWPNPDVVDIHAIFPNPLADPEQAESYDFRLTDEYLAAARATGAQIVYRLGESIEHTSVKRFVHPPKDPQKWAATALGIVRHYNDGWDKGFHYNIRYWEIWNEPENRPVMWTGSDADYFRLYQAATLAIKAHDPNLKVGGPSVGYTGQFKDGVFVPSDFVTAFWSSAGGRKRHWTSSHGIVIRLILRNFPPAPVPSGISWIPMGMPEPKAISMSGTTSPAIPGIRSHDSLLALPGRRFWSV